MDSSTNRIANDHYSRAQIALHWVIFALIVVQLISHEAMEHAFEGEDGATGGVFGDPLAVVHAISGLAILVLMIARIGLRLRLGAPALPADLPSIQKLAAHASHFTLYGLLILLPLTGATAVVLGNEYAGDLHGLLVALLWIVLLLHVAGALYHALVRRDGVFWRIVVPR